MLTRFSGGESWHELSRMMDGRSAMNAIFFILRTGAQWNSLDAAAICFCSSAYRRFREGRKRRAIRQEAGFRARMWVVEHTHSWINRFRRILVRREKLAGTCPAMLHLACTLITRRAVGLAK